MSNFVGHAKSLSEQYVFYQRLNTDGYYPTLGKYVRNASQRILGQTKKYNSDSSAIRAQAQAEFAKEKALLQEKFGVTLNFDYYGGSEGAREGFKEVIDALNACLNLKDVYERNKQLIKNTKGMKGVFSWYPTYFMKAWEEGWPHIKAAWERAFARGMSAGDAMSMVLDKYLPQICISGIERMLDGPEVEHASIDPELRSAYSALVSQIGSVNTAGSVANQIYKAYQLDDLKEKLVKEVEVKNNKIYAKDMKPKVKGMITKNVHSTGGLTLEAIETAIFQMIASGTTNGGVIHSGSKGIKADNILTLGINPTMVYETLEKAGANREENIKALSELGEKLSNLDDGFIVYSSDKNFSLNKNFKGFESGSTGKNAADFLNNIPMLSSSIPTLIGAIQQLGEGAMLAGEKSAFEQLLAQDVAYMLFDDYTTIGDFSSGGKAIHVMNLNGILIPMSVILTLLADAMDAFGESEARRIVNVNIDAPAILWKTQKEQEKDYPYIKGRASVEAWNFQRQYALDNTKISMRFLRNFKSLIMQYL